MQNQSKFYSMFECRQFFCLKCCSNWDEVKSGQDGAKEQEDLTDSWGEQCVYNASAINTKYCEKKYYFTRKEELE